MWQLEGLPEYPYLFAIEGIAVTGNNSSINARTEKQTAIHLHLQRYIIRLIRVHFSSFSGVTRRIENGGSLNVVRFKMFRSKAPRKIIINSPV